MGSFYVTTAIPYVNAAPHLGFALELVQADALARYHRLCGDDTWFLTGTDENSLTNVLAAEREKVPIRWLVDRNAEVFRALTHTLHLSQDDFIRTATDRRHRGGAQRFWAACAAASDIYKRPYRGFYCVRCERFYTTDELVGGRCPEHDIEPEIVEEENYFFRLSRYADQLTELFASRALCVVPESRHHSSWPCRVWRFLALDVPDQFTRLQGDSPDPLRGQRWRDLFMKASNRHSPRGP